MSPSSCLGVDDNLPRPDTRREVLFKKRSSDVRSEGLVERHEAAEVWQSRGVCTS